MPQEEIGKVTERILNEEGPLHRRLNRISTLLGVVRYNELANLLKNIIAPLFFRDYPDGRIYFIVVDDSLPVFLAMLRVSYVCSIYESSIVDAMVKNSAVKTFEELTGRVGNLGALESILSSLFFPKFYFFGSMRVEASILFQLDSPYEFRPQYPYDFFDLVRYGESFKEDVPIDLTNIQELLSGSSTEGERLGYGRFLHKKPWTGDELEIFVRWYIPKINEMLYQFLDATNFVDSGTDYVSFVKQFNFLHTIQRILAETATIMTERDPQVRKPLFFELLDKYGAILKNRTSDKNKKNDAENFKTLLKVTNYESNIKPIVQNIIEPFGSYFAEEFGQTIFEEIHKVVIDGIWAKSRISGDEVKLVKWDKNSQAFVDQGNTQTKEEYVVNMLRTVRNTHHGYLDDDRFEKFLSIHSGSTPHYIADLAQLFVLSMLADPKSLLEARWI